MKIDTTLLSEYIEAIAYFADYFIENNGVDYAALQTKAKKIIPAFFLMKMK